MLEANTSPDVCGNLSGIFGGILAFAFDHASGAGGLSGWQWLFLTEAIATILMGVAVWFLLPDCKSTYPSYDSAFRHTNQDANSSSDGVVAYG